MSEALLEAAVRLATPLLIAALGELVVERAGLVNIGIEGMMLTGAFAAFAVAVASGSTAAGAAAGVTAAAAVGVLFAAASVWGRVDPIVTGTALNLLALGGTGLVHRALHGGQALATPTAPLLEVPLLSALPWIGSAFFRQSAFVYAGFALAAALGVALARTRPGLALRAVGEAARAADAEGIAVARVRGAALVAGAAAAGLAGAVLTLSQSNVFNEGMTSGRGFIALAIVIFGRWRAGGVVLAALFFGLANALQFRLQARGLDLPYPAFLMFPYLVTLAVLAFASAGARAPADLARPYHREGGRTA